MAPASNEEQFKFLISCIRYSNNGKVDFGQVAQECKIVSKGAAAKRYERMMRAHGIAPNAATIKPSSTRNMKSESRDSKNQISKKRKASAFIEENTAADDEETFSRVKPDPAQDKEHPSVKVESGQLSLDEAANLMQYYDTPSYGSQIRADDVYPGSEYNSSSSSYHSAIGGSYGLQDQQQFDFSFTPASINNDTSLAQSIQYQPLMQYPATDNQGGSESPLIVD